MNTPYCCPYQQYYSTMMPQIYQPHPYIMESMPQQFPMVPYVQSPVMGNVPWPEDIYNAQDNIPATSDPPPVLSDNPAVTSAVAFKELTGYPNYGNPSGNADILYTGNRGTWTFTLPAYLTGGIIQAQLIIRAVLDDHGNVPVNRYSARITVNGTVVHDGRVPLEHGVPVGGRFTNWRSLTFTIRDIRRNNRIVIQNTSTAGANDWIALDWMEMRFAPR